MFLPSDKHLIYDIKTSDRDFIKNHISEWSNLKYVIEQITIYIFSLYNLYLQKYHKELRKFGVLDDKYRLILIPTTPIIFKWHRGWNS